MATLLSKVIANLIQTHDLTTNCFNAIDAAG
jgi:hypothetical protein